MSRQTNYDAAIEMHILTYTDECWYWHILFFCDIRNLLTHCKGGGGGGGSSFTVESYNGKPSLNEIA